MGDNNHMRWETVPPKPRGLTVLGVPVVFVDKLDEAESLADLVLRQPLSREEWERVRAEWQQRYGGLGNSYRVWEVDPS